MNTATWKEQPILAFTDGSYGITLNGLPYHVPDNAEFAALYAQVAAYATAHPERVERETPPPGPTPEEIIDGFTRRIQNRLDLFARSKGYDSIFTACTYAASTVDEFAVEGRYAVEARDVTWKAANAVMNAVLAGERAVPTWAELEAQLPPLAWPEGARPDTEL